jgi:hypothetical protein
MNIIIFHEKHGDSIYDASTPEAIARACASIIKERYEQGWYYAPEPPKPLSDEDQAVLDLDDETLAAMPAAIRTPLFEKRTKLAKRHKSLLRNYLTAMEEFNAIEAIALASSLDEAAAMTRTDTYTLSTGEVKMKVKNLARWVIDGRGDFEYEGYSIESLNEPTW